MTETLIGLLDYDLIYTKKYISPNYDLGLVYAHLNKDPNLTVRFIVSLANANLSIYDKIYVFKRSRLTPHPSSQIKDYYQFPVEEYGVGFLSKPLRPFFMETRFSQPNFKCYNNLLMFSIDNPRHKLALRIDRGAKSGKYQQLRLFEPFENELLRRDMVTPKNKRVMIHDDPAILLNSGKGVEVLKDLISKNYTLKFAQYLDISYLKDVRLLEPIFTEPKLYSLRTFLYVTELNDKWDELVNYVMTQKVKEAHITVIVPIENCTRNMIELLRAVRVVGKSLVIRPVLGLPDDPLPALADLISKYLKAASHKMSLYEYVFNIGFLRLGASKSIIKTREGSYEFLLNQYGMPKAVKILEDWMQRHPEDVDIILGGGHSRYEEQRRKFYPGAIWGDINNRGSN